MPDQGAAEAPRRRGSSLDTSPLARAGRDMRRHEEVLGRAV
jgi:hypothetical protein